ncbi:hypothetical protein Taro_024404, partial [Colocasia esculenta]|nr:hypothetical protein [Colocasia esculenta]
MGKPSLAFFVYTLLAVCLLLLLASSPRHHRHHRRLKLRSNFSFSPSPPGRDRDHAVPFDPLVADLERRREDREWERAHFSMPHHEPAPGEEAQPEWEDFLDAEDYLNDDERFNLTHRLVALFPNIDVDPTDGFLSAEELTQWNSQQEAKEVLHRTRRDMELHDKNRDGFVSFKEYEPPSWARYQSDGKNSSEHGVGWWSEEHFNASDVDADGLLNLAEFNDPPTCRSILCPFVTVYFMFLQLFTSSRQHQPKTHSLAMQRDKDGDGKLNFQEYFNGLFDSIRDFNEFYNSTHQSDEATEPMAKKLFAEIDHDNDGLLSEEELKSVIGIIHPSERFYAKQQADRALEE